MFSRSIDRDTERSHYSMLSLILATIAVLLPLACVLSASAQASAAEDLQKQIKNFETTAAQANPPAMDPVSSGRVWARLGQLYEDAGRYAESENAYTHSIRLIRNVPGAEADLACAIDGLGALYMMRGDLEQSERSLDEALSIRQAKGLQSDLEVSWFHLAALALRERRFGKAHEYAQLALDRIQAEPRPHAIQEVNTRFALGIALCGMRHYPEAIAIMQAAMDDIRHTYKPGDLSIGFGSFVLGFAYWKSGDAERSRGLMKEGVEMIEKDLGWGHPVCLGVMDQYKRYLRSTGRREEAKVIGEELKEHGGSLGMRPEQSTLSIEALF